MTLSKDNRKNRPPQTRNQKILMWGIYIVAGAMLVVAIILLIVKGAPLF